LAKAALPSLTRESDDPAAYKKILLNTLYQMMFFIIPVATILIVLRVPIVRLVYGTDIFDWNATVMTGLVLTSFAIGIPVQAALTLISRAFYALHDTRTPVVFAIFDVFLTIFIQVICIFVLHLPVWSLALAHSLAGFVQISLLYYLLSKKLHNGSLFSLLPVAKSLVGGVLSGLVMFTILKTFDKSAWIKRLSFINSIDALKNLNFENFVLDTRYTFNLLVLTVITASVGMVVYIIVLALLRSEELALLTRIIQTRAFSKVEKEEEPITTSQAE
jgi:putative peptidoglycan lipid II flippase